MSTMTTKRHRTIHYHKTTAKSHLMNMKRQTTTKPTERVKLQLQRPRASQNDIKETQNNLKDIKQLQNDTKQLQRVTEQPERVTKGQ